MKRLALRISGGIMLAVLALLAVGQAQRGAPAAAESNQTPHSSQNTQGLAVPTPENSAATPRPFTSNGTVNPLRPDRPHADAATTPALQTMAGNAGSAPAEKLPGVSAPASASVIRTADRSQPLDPFASPTSAPAEQTPSLAAPALGDPAARSSGKPSTSAIAAVAAEVRPTQETSPQAPSAAAAIPHPGQDHSQHAGQASPNRSGGPASQGPSVVPPWTVPLSQPNVAADPTGTSAARTYSIQGVSDNRTNQLPRPRVAGASTADEPGLFHPDEAAPGKSIAPVPPSASPAASRRVPTAGPSSKTGVRASGPQADQPTPQVPADREPNPRHAETDAQGSGVPGARELEGPQTPQIVVQKIAPPEVQVGKPAVFEIHLKNTGQVPAQNVEVHDEIPKGTRLLDTQPKASRGVRGELVWSLGTVKPNDEVRLQVHLMPTDEGVLGSKATVVFGAEASARTVSTKPMLVLKTVAPQRVQIGEEVTFQITVSNPGTGVAHQVVLEERVPPGLQHPAGSDLVYEVGSLKPGESRQLELKLLAVQAGMVANVLTARGDANLKAEDRLELEVLAPQLDITLEGPKRRYLEREATYTVSISNPGTAPARQVELIAQLPPGLKFVSANNAGHYQEATRTVHWTLEELPSKETGSVQLTTVPVEPGQQFLRLRSTAEKGLSVEKEMPVIVEGIASPSFQVTDTSDPVEVGGETTYQIRVFNQGSKAASNVQLLVLLPSELRVVAAEPTARQSSDPRRIVFDPLQHLAPKAETIYRIRVQAIKPGNHRMRAQLSADEMEPVTKEESTRVYSDE